MTDTFTKQKRSEIMRAVKSKGNKSTEIKLIEIFKLNKIVGWRRNYKLFGKPDFTFPKKKIALFIDGCFWHGHKCRNTTPKDNAAYWKKKIKKNQIRDIKVTELLTNKGWRFFRVWECELQRHFFLSKLKRFF